MTSTRQDVSCHRGGPRSSMPRLSWRCSTPRLRRRGRGRRVCQEWPPPPPRTGTGELSLPSRPPPLAKTQRSVSQPDGTGLETPTAEGQAHQPQLTGGVCALEGAHSSPHLPPLAPRTLELAEEGVLPIRRKGASGTGCKVPRDAGTVGRAGVPCAGPRLSRLGAITRDMQVPLRRRADSAGSRPPLPRGGSAGNRPGVCSGLARDPPPRGDPSRRRTRGHEDGAGRRAGGARPVHPYPRNPCGPLGGPGRLPPRRPLGPPTTCGTITCCLASTAGFGVEADAACAAAPGGGRAPL